MTCKRKLLLFCFLPIASVFALLIVIARVRFVQEPGREIGAKGTSIPSNADRAEMFWMIDSRYGVNPKKGISGDVITDCSVAETVEKAEQTPQLTVPPPPIMGEQDRNQKASRP